MLIYGVDFVEENTETVKAFHCLKAEQQRKVAAHKPQLMKAILQNMSYEDWKQYKRKQRSDGRANSYAKNKK